MADPNGPVFTSGLAPSRHSFTDNQNTGRFRARQFINAARSRRSGRRPPLERLAWYAAGLVTGAGLAIVVTAGTVYLNGCGW